MIEEAYVSFETAKMLKEKNFDLKANHIYRENGKYCCLTESVYYNSIVSKNEYTAPSQSIVMRWLREVFHLYIITNLIIDFGGKLYWDYSIDTVVNTDRVSSISTDIFDSYEEAVEAAIKYCLENLI